MTLQNIGALQVWKMTRNLALLGVSLFVLHSCVSTRSTGNRPSIGGSSGQANPQWDPKPPEVSPQTKIDPAFDF